MTLKIASTISFLLFIVSCNILDRKTENNRIIPLTGNIYRDSIGLQDPVFYTVVEQSINNRIDSLLFQLDFIGYGTDKMTTKPVGISGDMGVENSFIFMYNNSANLITVTVESNLNYSDGHTPACCDVTPLLPLKVKRIIVYQKSTLNQKSKTIKFPNIK